MKQNPQVGSRAEDPLLSIAECYAPSPSTAYYPPIFLPPSSFPAIPSPSPMPAAAAVATSPHSSLPKAAIIGGSVAGAVVALAVTATIISTVAGKAGLSCLLAPLLKLLTSLGSTVTGPCAKLNSFCSDLQQWIRTKEGSDYKTADAPGKADRDIDLSLARRSPEAVITKAETAASTHVYSLAKLPLHDVQPGTSAQSFLTTQVNEIADKELKKQKALIMEPLNQNVASEAQAYFESLYSATSNASCDELKALRSSAQAAYLDEIGKLKASAEHIAGNADGARMYGEDVINSSSVGSEYAAEIKRLQNLKNGPLEAGVLMLNRELAQSSSSGREVYIHHEQDSNQYMPRSDAGGHRGVLNPIIETLSDASEFQEEKDAIVPSQRVADWQNMSSVGLIPPRAAAGAEGHAIQPTAGPIVPIPTKAITPLPTRMMAPSTVAAAAARKSAWQPAQQRKKSTTNLGRMLFSCKISAYKLHFFTSCRSGGSYGSSPSPSHAGNDLPLYNSDSYVEMHELDLDSNNKESNYYNNAFASHPSINYGGNKHVGLLASSSAPIRHHYNIANVQNQQSITNSITSTNGSYSQAPLESLDYGNPFDGVV
ncbi:hypothetical protein GOP47_0012920 [Adiantum capillus-veneris]|uniref:Uncharacterized protein n=1 Tax=Adiantum capillus-veneris TaxID=13818 RepID=A0A9D4UQW8_ADICA|nr:hypothetical protein GOP47_0012288 [Adiantum capillus-veneris]KAI5072814.1 hypothetical protein GOP47_0012920 [Adiantum capillus-veneris]